MPYDEKHLISKVHFTGEGSNLQDITNAGRALGLVVRTVTANDAGLIALPKPTIAHVEHDHFVSVVAANHSGVTYLCNDCGRSPMR